MDLDRRVDPGFARCTEEKLYLVFDQALRLIYAPVPCPSPPAQEGETPEAINDLPYQALNAVHPTAKTYVKVRVLVLGPALMAVTEAEVT